MTGAPTMGLRKPYTIRTPDRRAKFLETIARGASVTLACRVADMSHNAAYVWRREDPSFAAEWDEAYEQGTDHFEDVLLRLATEGNLIATIFALKSRRPNIYNRRMILDPSDNNSANSLVPADQPKRIIYIPENHRDDPESEDE